MAIGTWGELQDEVAANGDLLCVELQLLRGLTNKSKLGRWVAQEIARSLTDRGLGYWPREILDVGEDLRATQQIRIYQRGSGVGRLIDAVLDPGEQGDERLRKAGKEESSTELETLKNNLRELLDS